MSVVCPDATPADAWRAADPLRLPAWRTHLRDYFRQPHVHERLALRAAAWHESQTPYVPGRSGPTTAGRILARQEVQRLDDARLYYADEDMTALSVAVGAKRPEEPVSIDRMPSPAGFQLFATPLGSYTATSREMFGVDPLPEETPTLHVPIVAVSWSIWSPTDRIPNTPVSWMYRTADEEQAKIPDSRGIWLTYYSTRSMGFELLPPETRLGTEIRSRRAITAGDQVRQSKGHAPLSRVDSFYLPFGKPFHETAPHCASYWTQAVYTAWQLIQQEGPSGWTETEDLTVRSKSPGRKRDPQRDTVRVIRLRPPRRPSREATERDRAAADSENPTRYTHRFPVPPYRRPNACWNSAIHSDDPKTRLCKHAEQIVAGSIRGPKHLPLRVGPVFKLTPPPDEPTAADGGL
ncbi:hypothetical protein [Streptacidiphilus jiangxiensis]|uniref:Uncharacterized protein n=1 Tax=Streptacidiphilus jiangxiensis TaxID=235985 RepID=A0A1H8B3Y6_STRJI|nr:hypothetical protein [Streptacidiphilus jiangxiensis]SEM77642.1 hypothetical protein SAMN05414137_1575 [Streptacidiphilus jiangxiensis]